MAMEEEAVRWRESFLDLGAGSEPASNLFPPTMLYKRPIILQLAADRSKRSRSRCKTR